MKLDTKKITANTAWMIFDKVFLLMLNLHVTVKIANYFGVTEYGSYQYAMSIIAVLEILVTFVDGRVVKKRYISEEPELLVFTATICRVLFSVASTFVGLIFLSFNKQNFEFAVMFIVLLINMILINLRFGMTNRFEYLLKSKKTVIAADLSALIGSFLQLGAVKFKLSITAISVIAAISSLANLVIVTIQYKIEFRDILKKSKYVDRLLIKEMIKESAPLAVAASCATIYTRCDSIMLGAMLSTKEVGIYAISMKLVGVAQIAISPIRESVYPRMIQLYSIDKEKYGGRYVQITSLLTWIYIIGVLISLIFLPGVFKLLKPEYAKSFSVYKIHVIGTFFMYNAALRAGHLTLIGRGDILMYSQIVSVIVNIVLNIFGITIWGMYGAALATVLTQAVSLLISNMFFGKTGKEILIWQIKALNPLNIIRLYRKEKMRR